MSKKQLNFSLSLPSQHTAQQKTEEGGRSESHTTMSSTTGQRLTLLLHSDGGQVLHKFLGGWWWWLLSIPKHLCEFILKVLWKKCTLKWKIMTNLLKVTLILLTIHEA